MPLFIPNAGFSDVENNLAATPSTTVMGTTITCHATPHTKGSYAELIAATNYDVQLLVLHVNGVQAAGANSATLLDIAIGGAGSEQVILPNLIMGGAPAINYLHGRTIYLPMRIPAATRIAARAQSVVGGKTFSVACFCFSGSKHLPWPAFRFADAYGPNTATSGGVAHTAGNTGTESAWASVGSTASRDYQGVLALMGTVNNSSNLLAFHFEFGINSGNPSFGELAVFQETGETVMQTPCCPFYAPVASGSQMQVRGECSGTAQALDVALYGLY